MRRSLRSRRKSNDEALESREGRWPDVGPRDRHHLEECSHLLRAGEAIDIGAQRFARCFVGVYRELRRAFPQAKLQQEIALRDWTVNGRVRRAGDASKPGKIDVRGHVRVTGRSEGVDEAMAAHCLQRVTRRVCGMTVVD